MSADVRTWVEDNFPGGRWVKADEYRVSSPLREEKTPSFDINISKRAFIDRGGDSGKLTDLAERLGLEAPPWEGHASSLAPVRRAEPQDNGFLHRWGEAAEARGHPYLAQKGLEVPHGLKVDGKGNLLIPSRDFDGRLIGIQEIAPDGSKRFMKGSHMGVFILGDLAEADSVLVVEGLGTGQALRQALGLPVAVSFSASRVPAIVRELRGRTAATIVAATDADDAGRKAAADAGVGTFIPSGDSGRDWADVLKEGGAEAIIEAWKSRPVPAKGKSVPRDAASLLRSPAPDKAQAPEEIWIFPRGHVSVIASDPGAGKSMLMANAAADLSRGGKILGGKEEPARKVLFLNGEAGRALFDARFRLGGWEFDPDNLKVVHLEEAQSAEIALELDTGPGREAIRHLVETVKPDCLIVDSLVAFFGGDQNDAQAVRSVTVFLKGLAAKFNMAVCVVHHLRKRGIRDTSVELTQNEIQGSNSILKLVSLVAGIETRKDDDGDGEAITRIVRPLKTWGRPFSPFAFRFEDGDDDSFKLVFDHDPILRGDSGKRGAWAALSLAFGHGEPFTRAAVESVCRVSDGLARRYLRDWAAVGKLTREGSGRSTTYRIALSSNLSGTSPSGTSKKSTGREEKPVIPTVPSGTGGTGKVPEEYRKENHPVRDDSFRYKASTGWDRCNHWAQGLSGTFSTCTGSLPVPDGHHADPAESEGEFPLRGDLEPPERLAEGSDNQLERPVDLESWLEEQSAEVKADHAARLARLRRAKISTADELALLRTWEATRKEAPR